MSTSKRLLWQLVAVVSTSALMGVLWLMDSRYWFRGDKRNQYIPVAQDIGRRLRDGEFPTIDPDLGTGGNFSLDLQYGLYEPTHWVVAVVLSHLDNLQLAGFLWAAAYLVILAWGTTALTLRLGASGPWAASAGLGAATSGYLFFWLAINWIPGLVSMAWLPWLWWAWVGSVGARRCVAIAVFAYLVAAGGWPATWLMFLALATGFAFEAFWTRDRAASRQWMWDLGIRAGATLAGMIPALLTVYPLARASGTTVRTTRISNDNFLVANLADILSFAAPDLHGDLSSFGGMVVMDKPLYFAGWFALPLLWLMPWRPDPLRRPGVLTGVIGGALMLLATQFPSNLGPLRDSIRALPGFQVFGIVAVIALMAGAGPLVFNRGRAWGIAVSLAAMGFLSWARDPGADPVLAMVAAAVAVAVVTALVAARRTTLAGVAALVASLLLTTMTFQLTSFVGKDAASPSRLPPPRVALGVDSRPILAIYGRKDDYSSLRFFRDGVGESFQRLSARTRMAPGYSSLRQRAYSKRFCTLVAQGDSCPQVVKKLFETEPTTGKPWIDLLGYKTVVIAGPNSSQAFNALSGPQWRQVNAGRETAEFQRTGPVAVAGRVTHVIGDADLQAKVLTRKVQSYDVSTDSGATLIFRDLFWPGYRATFDGRRIAVRPFGRILVSVTLPPGSTGRLEITYRPIPHELLYGLPLVGVALLGAVMVLARRVSRRSSGPPDGGRREEHPPADDRPEDDLPADDLPAVVEGGATRSDQSAGAAGSGDVEGDGDHRQPHDGKHLQHPV